MPLKGETLKGYNNLPAIPIEQPLGDLLNTIPVGDPALEAPAGGVATLYVSATGSDDTGDGSQANPYATPQMAIDSIPATIEKDSLVEIFCGAGTFTFPDVSRIPSDIQCALIGDTSNPAITIPAGSVSFAALPGKNARWQANVGPYSDVITDGSHWMSVDLSFLGWATRGNVVSASTSPNLDIISGSDLGFLNLVVYAYTTVFEINPALSFSNLDSEGPFGARFSTKRVSFSGIDIKGYNVNANFKNLAFFGCKFSLGAGYFNSSFTECAVSSYFEKRVSIYDFCEVFSCYFTDTVTIEAKLDSVYASVITKTVSIKPASAVPIASIDFEGSGDCLRIQDQSSISIFGDCSVAATKSTFINGTSALNATVKITGGTTITGSVTGNAITLVQGSQATGVENACNGTLTAGGSEIVVGGNGGQTFASLPATDLGAASPQLCRAD